MSEYNKKVSHGHRKSWNLKPSKKVMVFFLNLFFNFARTISFMHNMWLWHPSSVHLQVHYFLSRFILWLIVLLTFLTSLLTGLHSRRKWAWKILILSWKSNKIYFSDLYVNPEQIIFSIPDSFVIMEFHCT